MKPRHAAAALTLGMSGCESVFPLKWSFWDWLGLGLIVVVVAMIGIGFAALVKFRNY
jgi:hypothetical protein